MRRFRFWDKLEKKMIYSENSGSKEYPVLLAIGLHGLPIAIDNDSFRNNDIIGWNRDHNLIRMDSTGLKDKNGKEIYEGDIVSFNLKTDAKGCPNIIGYIEYQTTFSSFRIMSILGSFALDCNINEIEVIGNVHENSELLEVHNG